MKACSPVWNVRVAARTGRFHQQRREALDPPEQGHVVHLDPALGEQLFQVAVEEPVARVPGDREEDHLRREPEPP